MGVQNHTLPPNRMSWRPIFSFRSKIETQEYIIITFGPGLYEAFTEMHFLSANPNLRSISTFSWVLEQTAKVI